MKFRNLFSYMALLLTTSLTACMNQDDFIQQEDGNEVGSIELSFGANTRSTTTTISPEEANNFLVTITKSGEIVRGPQTLGTLNTRLPAGQDYKVYAESCTEADAELMNNHWGQKRFVGNSDVFGINKGETTKVRVGMSVDNAAMCVVIHPSLANYFKNSCTITLSEPNRALQWNYENAGKVENGETTDGQIAYFNIDETGSREVEYTIEASSDNQTITKTGTMKLSRAKMSRLNLAYDSGFFTLTLSVNEEDLYVDSKLVVGPNDITSDQGETDVVGGHDGFNNDDSGVDYDQYN